MIERTEASCPHCGAHNEVEVDYSAGGQQQFIEDCWICCRPIQYQLQIDYDGDVKVYAEKAY